MQLNIFVIFTVFTYMPTSENNFEGKSVWYLGNQFGLRILALIQVK